MIGDDILTDVKGAQDAVLFSIITFIEKFRPGDIDTCDNTSDMAMRSIAALPPLLRRNNRPSLDAT